MRILEERILKDGEVYPGEVLKVGSFLNQQIDTELITLMGKEIADRFRDQEVTKVLTIETSGVALAFATAQALGVPMIIAKKHKSNNLDPVLVSTKVFSYTHQSTYDVVVSREFIDSSDNILIVDDFLAKGNAIMGLYEIIDTADANCAGAAVAIEKGFQNGGKKIRDMGIDLMSLAIIESMTDDSLTFASQD
ncbi:MAG: xanthine phosphoribosyltransferase [Clostridiales bacterium]|jgi:xanthine phosphoribosyltransferase|nr:xanthine phosphoribosyltransferase [Clostridiales bacterium]